MSELEIQGTGATDWRPDALCWPCRKRGILSSGTLGRGREIQPFGLHGTWQDEASDVRRINPETGQVLERLQMPAGTGLSGLESDGGERFVCGGGNFGKVRAIRKAKEVIAAS